MSEEEIFLGKQVWINGDWYEVMRVKGDIVFLRDKGSRDKKNLKQISHKDLVEIIKNKRW